MLLLGALPVLRGEKKVRLTEINRLIHFSQEKVALKIEIFESFLQNLVFPMIGFATTVWWQLKKEKGGKTKHMHTTAAPERKEDAA